MADITYHCKGCQQELSVSDEWCGKDLACPTCGCVMTVPRARTRIALRGRPSAQSATARADDAPENLSDLAEIDAFGAEREAVINRKRQWALARQITASIGMLLTVVVVVYVAYRFYDARETRKRRIAEDFLRQKEVSAAHQAIRVEARELLRKARSSQPDWYLAENDVYLLWRALTDLYPDRKQAQARFQAWVELDGAMSGLFSEVYGQLQTPGAIEIGCQRLAGFALGLVGESAPLPPLDEFRRLAALKLGYAE